MKKQLKGCLAIVAPGKGKKVRKQQQVVASTAAATLDQLRSYFQEIDKEELQVESGSESEMSVHIASNDGSRASQTEVSSQPSSRLPLTPIREETSPEKRPEKQLTGSTSNSQKKGKQAVYSRRLGARRSPAADKENQAGTSKRPFG